MANLSKQAEALLLIFKWEKERPEPVTVNEIVRRTSMTREQVKAAIEELFGADMIAIEGQAEGERA